MKHFFAFIIISAYVFLLTYLTLIDLIFWLPIFLAIGLVVFLTLLYESYGGFLGFVFVLFISLLTFFISSGEMTVHDLLFGILMHFIITLIMVKLKISIDNLRESEERYRILVENANDGIIMTKKEVISYVNPALLDMIGYAREEIIGKDILSLFKDDNGSARNYYKKRKNGEKTFPLYEGEIRSSSGKYISVEMSTASVTHKGIYGELIIIRDISKRKKIEEVLRYQEEKFRTLSENTPDIIARFDRDCRYVYINPAGEREYERPKKDFFWKREEDLNLSDDSSRALNDAISTVFKTKKATSFYKELFLKDKKKDFYTILVPELDERGEVRSVLSISRDITEIREIDKAKTEFISLTSHQLRSPMSIISWCITSLMQDDDLTLNEEQKSHVQSIYESNRKLIKITDAFINATMLDLDVFVFNPEDTDVIRLVKYVIGEYEDLMSQKNIDLIESYRSFSSLSVDSRMIKIILRSLISNAVDYTQSGGKISVSVHKRDENSVIIRVGDSGCGVSVEDGKNIFKKFYRSKEAKNIKSYGTGLDMYIIKSILDKRGGEISLESPNVEFGKGTAFTVTIPVGVRDSNENQSRK